MVMTEYNLMSRLALVLLVAAFVISACQVKEVPLQESRVTVLSAEIDASTKAAVSDAGAVSWTSGDSISVFDGDAFETLVLVSGDGTATGEFRGNMFAPAQTCALYPASAQHACDGSRVNFYLPDSYAYAENGNARMPMMALLSGTGNLKFRQLGGVIKVRYNGIPAAADRFVFGARGLRVSGNYTIPLSKESILVAEAGSTGNTVSIHFSPSASISSRTFYVPLPTGEYPDFYVALYAGNSLLDLHNGRHAMNVIAKGTLLIMPTISVTGGVSSTEYFQEENIW